MGEGFAATRYYETFHTIIGHSFFECLNVGIDLSDDLELIVHTARHVRRLRKQVGPQLESVLLPTASKTLMLNALNAAELDLRYTIDYLIKIGAAKDPVCGTWTMQNLIGHLADWDAYFINWLADLTGKTVQDLYWDDDGDRFNAWLSLQRRNNTWKQDWEDFLNYRRSLIVCLNAVSDNEFLQEIPDRRIATYPTIYHCAWSALEHYLAHAAGLRRQAQMAVPDDLLHFHGPYTE